MSRPRRAPAIAALLAVLVLTPPSPALGAEQPAAAPLAGERPAAGPSPGAADPADGLDRVAGRHATWTWPLDSGARRADVTVLRRFERPPHTYGPGHRGVDLAADPASVVRSPASGVVAFAGPVAGRPVVAVQHRDGFRSAMEPVEATVEVGTVVRRGDPIGRVASGPRHCPARQCLHWGVRHHGDYIDPLPLLARRVVLLPTGPAGHR